MFPVDEHDAGFVVVPKSHKSFRPEFKGKADWHVVDQEAFLPKAVKLLIPKNCITLWNSRLVHANAGMSPDSRETTINRMVWKKGVNETLDNKTEMKKIERI